MALVNLTKFWQNKSIKLSDSFDVLIRYSYYDENEKEMDFERLVNCTGFTLPKLEYEEETYEYGNVAQVFVKPKYDSCKELTLEFTEYMTTTENKSGTIYDNSVVLNKILKSLGYNLTQKYTTGLSVNYAQYARYNEKKEEIGNILDDYISEIDIKIMNNKLWRYVYKYHFANLKIVNYSIYNLDYQSESPCKVSVTLAFETYKKEVIDEPIWEDEQKQVEQPTPKESPKQTKEEKYDPNGKVQADSISIDGQTYANKQDIEMNWKNAANQDDLASISNEQLYNPAFNEIQDLDLDDDDQMTPELQTAVYQNQMNDDDLASLRQRPELAELEDLDLDDKPIVSNPPVENQVASNGQVSGGYKQPSVGSNGSSGGDAASQAYQKAAQKAELANKQEKENTQVASSEKTYGGLTAGELGKRAAQYDKNNPNGTYKSAAMNAVGLDAKARKEVENAYNAEMKKG